MLCTEVLPPYPEFICSAVVQAVPCVRDAEKAVQQEFSNELFAALSARITARSVAGKPVSRTEDPPTIAHLIKPTKMRITRSNGRTAELPLRALRRLLKRIRLAQKFRDLSRCVLLS